MTKYESTIVYSVKDEALTAANIAKFEELIKANAQNVTIDTYAKDGKAQDLAYEINKERKGVYYLYTFESDEAFVAELERVLGITDGVLRWLTVKYREYDKLTKKAVAANARRAAKAAKEAEAAAAEAEAVTEETTDAE